MFGKWHLGDNYPYRRGDRGFHEVVRHGWVLEYQAGLIGERFFDDTYWHNGTTQKYKGYCCTDVFLFRRPWNFIEEKQNDPFFLLYPTRANMDH